jgi:hypothetical protein
MEKTGQCDTDLEESCMLQGQSAIILGKFQMIRMVTSNSLIHERSREAEQKWGRCRVGHELRGKSRKESR